MSRAYEREASESAKNAIGQILINSRMAAEGHRPMCQDTGIVVVFIKIGQSVVIDGDISLQSARAYFLIHCFPIELILL